MAQKRSKLLFATTKAFQQSLMFTGSEFPASTNANRGKCKKCLSHAVTTFDAKNGHLLLRSFIGLTQKLVGFFPFIYHLGGDFCSKQKTGHLSFQITCATVLACSPGGPPVRLFPGSVHFVHQARQTGRRGSTKNGDSQSVSGCPWENQESMILG